MKGVWRTDAVAIAALVAVNLLARLVVRLVGPEHDMPLWSVLWSAGIMCVLAAVAAFEWARRYLTGRVVADSLVVVGITSLLVTLLGPLVTGGGPFKAGVDLFILQLLICIAALAVAVFVGALIAMAFGVDPKSRAWKQQAERIKAAARKPQRQRKVAKR